MEKESFKDLQCESDSQSFTVCPTQYRGPQLVSQLQELKNQWRLMLHKDEGVTNITTLIESTRQVHQSVLGFVGSINCQQCSTKNSRALFGLIEDGILLQEQSLGKILDGSFAIKAVLSSYEWAFVQDIAQIRQYVNRIVCYCQAQSILIELDDDFQNEGLKQVNQDQYFSSKKQKLQQQPQTSVEDCPTLQFTRVFQQQLVMLIDHVEKTVPVVNPAPYEPYISYFIYQLKSLSNKWDQYQLKPKCLYCNAYRCYEQRHSGKLRIHSCLFTFQNFFKQYPKRIVPRLRSTIYWLQNQVNFAHMILVKRYQTVRIV